MTTKRSPSFTELIGMIDELISETKTRQEVASWAHLLYSNDDLTHSESVAEVLKNLGAADLFGGNRPYLFTKEDFNKWKATLITQYDDGTRSYGSDC